MHGIIGVSDVSSISIGRIFVSNDVVRSHTGQPFVSDTIRQRRLSFFWLSVPFRVPTFVKTTPELYGPAFGVLRNTGDEALKDCGKPG